MTVYPIDESRLAHLTSTNERASLFFSLGSAFAFLVIGLSIDPGTHGLNIPLLVVLGLIAVLFLGLGKLERTKSGGIITAMKQSVVKTSSEKSGG